MGKKINKRINVIKYKILATTLAGLAFFSIGCSKTKDNKLVEIELPKKIEDTIDSQTSQNDEIYKIEFEEENTESTSIDYQKYINNYINKMSMHFPEYDFSYFREMTNSLTFIENEYLSQSDIQAYYDKSNNQIFVDPTGDFENALYHEFNHIIGFKDDYKLSDEEYDGCFIDEGINRIICSEVFDNELNDICKQKVCSLDGIIPIDDMIDIYMNGSISDIKEELVKIDGNKDDAENFIESLDYLYVCSYYDEMGFYNPSLLENIQNKEINYFFNQIEKVEYDINNYNEVFMKIGQYYNLLIGSLETDLIVLDSTGSKKVFDERLDKLINTMSARLNTSAEVLKSEINIYIDDTSLAQIALNKHYLSGNENEYNDMENDYINNSEGLKMR